jgi:hypothetical protein
VNLRWAALCPKVPDCGWRDPGYFDEHTALAESRAHLHENHPGHLSAWPSREIGVVTHYPVGV